MKRPYVICHMLSSLDGKISGDFMNGGTAAELGREYGALREKMEADAWLYGTTTTKEFTGGARPVPEENFEAPEGDFVAEHLEEMYYISLDTQGGIGWESGTFRNRGRAEAHVVEILTEAAPGSYRAYLRKRGVSYILAGEKELNCKLAMEKLYQLFHIEKVALCGGGVANWTFLQAGVIDELSLLLAPAADGGNGASLFTQNPFFAQGKPVGFTLKSVERIGKDGVYLRYLAENSLD